MDLAYPVVVGPMQADPHGRGKTTELVKVRRQEAVRVSCGASRRSQEHIYNLHADVQEKICIVQVLNCLLA